MQDYDAFVTAQLRAAAPPTDYALDCFVSSEVAYNEVIARAIPVDPTPGGAYLGVGPDQNYTYIASLRPDLALILDARLDNLLEHLIFKVLFSEARDPLDYLCLLFARARPEEPARVSSTGRELVARFGRCSLDESPEALPLVRAAFERRWSEEPRILARVERILAEFTRRQLEVTSVSERCLSQLDKIPSFEEVICATTPEGSNLHYLTDLERFGYVKSLHARDRVVPILGNVTDASAVARVGALLAAEELSLRAIYLSNLEEFLLQRYVIEEDRVVARPNPDGRLEGEHGRAYAELVARLSELPCDEDAQLIRFFFPGEHRGRRLGVFPWLEPHVTFTGDFIRRFHAERPSSVMATYV